MGHFDVCCCVTGLPIRQHDKILAMLLEKRQATSHIACGIDDNWRPVTFPTMGMYNGFGDVDVIDPVFGQHYIQALMHNRYKPFFVLNHVWDYMVHSTNVALRVSADLKKLFESNTKDHLIISSTKSGEEFDQAYMRFGIIESILPTVGPSGYEGSWSSHWKKTVEKGLAGHDLSVFLSRVVKSLTFERHMHFLGKMWSPTSVCGQDSDYTMHMKFHKAVCEIASIKQREHDLSR